MLLDALLYIKDNIDHTFTIRRWESLATSMQIVSRRHLWLVLDEHQRGEWSGVHHTHPLGSAEVQAEGS